MSDTARVGRLDAGDHALFSVLCPDLLAVVAHDGRLLRLSESWAAVLGYPLDDLLGRPFLDLLHPEDVAPTLERAERALAGDHSGPPVENRYRHADGSYRWLRWHTGTDDDGTATWCVAQDVTTEHRRAERQQVVADLGRRALEQPELAPLWQAAVEGTARALDVPYAALAELQPGGEVLLVRAAVGLAHDDGSPVHLAADSSSVAGRALVGTRPVAVADVREEPEYSPTFQQAWGVRSVAAVPVGRPHAPWGTLSIGATTTRALEDEEVRFLEQVAHLVSAAVEHREAEARLQHQATHDDLTGLPNRELLHRRVEGALAEARRAGHAVGLLLCDLDGFKDVNDSLGHAAGDAVLRQLADRLRAAVGASGTVARLGGDEFAICVVGPRTEVEVLGVADEVVRVMRQPFTLPQLEVPLSTSIGVVVSPTHGRDAATLLRHADVAMYRAKSRRLGWALYDAGLDRARSDRLTLLTDLRTAIAHGDLDLHYQPVVDLRTGALDSLEALCRWTSPSRGAVPPSEFVPLAEQTGEIVPLTLWVVRRAAEQVRAWQAAGHQVRCAVNLSMAAVLHEQACQSLIEELRGAAPLLTVEITESWLADARGQQVVAELSAAGVELSLDDFGTGWSSLASLRSFPVRRLKLDRQFVLDLDRDARGGHLLRAVGELARALDVDVVAEGVEQEGTASRLREAGLRLGQGYLWCRPVPADELTAWAGWGVPAGAAGSQD